MNDKYKFQSEGTVDEGPILLLRLGSLLITNAWRVTRRVLRRSKTKFDSNLGKIDSANIRQNFGSLPSSTTFVGPLYIHSQILKEDGATC